MLSKKNKLAIIAGKGDLVTSCIEECKKKKLNFIIIALEDFYNNKKHKANIKLSFKNIGNIFHILEKHNVYHVIFIGSISKPTFYKLRPNFYTLYYLFKIIFYYFKGDNMLLNKIYKLFVSKGIKVIDSRKILNRNLANTKNNNLIMFKKNINLNQIKCNFNQAKKIGSKDNGQAIITQGNEVILKEDRNGTDNLILRYKNLNRKDKFSLLVKTAKPNQNLSLDLPTIGPRTILNIYKAKIKGIIIEKNKTFIVNPQETFKLIKKYKIFYYAY